MVVLATDYTLEHELRKDDHPARSRNLSRPHPQSDRDRPRHPAHDGNFNAAKREAKTTNPDFAAFRTLGAQWIAVLTPNSHSVNEFVQRSIEEVGFDVPVFGSFNDPNDPIVAAIDTASLKSAIARITSEAGADAVFISCTSVRIADAVAGIEAELDMPVTSASPAPGRDRRQAAASGPVVPPLTGPLPAASGAAYPISTPGAVRAWNRLARQAV